MIVLKDNREIGQIDEKEKKITTQSYPLRRIVRSSIEKGVVVGLKGWYDKKQEAFIDTAERIFPKDGKRFWKTLQEDLILEGYDIA